MLVSLFSRSEGGRWEKMWGLGRRSIATFDADYVLVREVDLEQAKAALRAAGHRVD